MEAFSTVLHSGVPTLPFSTFIRAMPTVLVILTVVTVVFLLHSRLTFAAFFSDLMDGGKIKQSFHLRHGFLFVRPSPRVRHDIGFSSTPPALCLDDREAVKVNCWEKIQRPKSSIRRFLPSAPGIWRIYKKRSPQPLRTFNTMRFSVAAPLTLLRERMEMAAKRRSVEIQRQHREISWHRKSTTLLKKLG